MSAARANDPCVQGRYDLHRRSGPAGGRLGAQPAKRLPPVSGRHAARICPAPPVGTVAPRADGQPEPRQCDRTDAGMRHRQFRAASITGSNGAA
jgi:hypothetical protein